jgi:hypothetical protein
VHFLHALIFFHVFISFPRSINTYKDTYILAYIYYSNDFDLRKIQVMQDLLEQNDCISQDASVMVLVLEICMSSKHFVMKCSAKRGI